MKESILPIDHDTSSPAGALVRIIMDGPTGGMIHSTVPVGQTNKPVAHRSVYEFWYILEGEGEIWRRRGQQEKITPLTPGTSIDIEPGTAFQYRNVSSTADLKFICVTMPPWPGNDEAVYVMQGAWEPSI